MACDAQILDLAVILQLTDPCRPGPVVALACRVIGDELRARTRRFALDVIALCLKLGRDDVGRLIGPQLLRAGTGVAANHRAAGQSRSRREFVSRLSVVVEEADESELWMDFLETLRFGPQDVVRRLRREAEELRSIFSASRSTAIRKGKSERARRAGQAREPDN